MALEEDTLEADIKAAIAETGGDLAIAPVVEAAPVAPAADAGNVETAEEKQQRIDATGRAHDEKGKFAAKAKDGSEPDKADAAGAPTPGKAEAAGEKPLVPPKDWAPEAKANFMAAPAAVQKQILAAHETAEAGTKEWSGKAADFERINKVIAPHMDKWARDGRTPDQAIGQLLAAQSAIERNPLEGLNYILRSYVKGGEVRAIAALAKHYGYTLAEANQETDPTQGEQPAEGRFDERRLQELIQQATRPFEEKLAARETAEQNAFKAQLRAEIDRFANDPAHVYYQNVKPKVAALLRIGDDAGDARPVFDRLKEAYEQAVYADPTTRALVIAEERKKADADAKATQQAKTEAARRAGVSVIGSPGPGAAVTPARTAPKSANLDQDIEADIRSALAAGRA